MQVDGIEENPTLGDKIVRGFRVKATALDGPEKGGSLALLFADGDATHKDKGEFARKKQAAMLIAANLLDPKDLGKDVDINLEEGEQAQFFVELEPSSRDEKYLEIRYANVFHIDDPRAKAYPRDKELLEMAVRREESFFAPLLKKKQTTKPAVKDDDFDDL